MKSKSAERVKKKIEFIDIIIFFSIVIVFGLSLLAFYPGLLTSDCVSQLNQAMSGVYTRGHPIFHSFIIGNIAKIFGSVSVSALFQIVVFATIWTWGCKKTRDINNTLKNRVFQFIVTLVIIILPLNFLYSITLWKDILYSYSFLAMLICIFNFIKNDFNISIKDILITSISIVCVMKFRYNGAVIGLIMFLILLILNFIKCKKIKLSAIFIVSFLIVYFITSIPEKLFINKNPQFNVGTVGGVLNGTILHTLGTLYNTDVEINQEDREFLNSILDIELWKKEYNPYTAGGIHYNPNLNSSIYNSKEGDKKLKQIFVKYAKQEPKAVIVHFIKLNSIAWSVKEYAPMHSVITNNGSISEMSEGKYDNHPILLKLNNKLFNYTVMTLSNKKIYMAIYRPATAMIISTILILIIVIKKKKISYLLMILPMFLNIGTYLILITSQDQRYYYPNFMTCYFLIILFGALFVKTNVKTKENKVQSENNKNTKVLVVVPAYNESESIKKVVESILEQKVENLDVVVVNDGSKDNTVEEAKKTNAIILDLPSNLGIGGAVQSGYLYALKNNYDIAIQIDGDGQHNPQYISKMVELIKNNKADMVIGSRFIEKTNYNQTFMRMLGINITSFIIKVFTERKIYDTTSGYRAVNKDIIKEFANEYPYDYPEPITTMQMILKGKEIKEMPVEMNQRTTGVSSISPFKSVIYMIKVTLSLILNSLRK